MISNSTKVRIAVRGLDHYPRDETEKFWREWSHENPKIRAIGSDFVTSGLNTVNLMCMDDVAVKLSKTADFPIAATSANVSGQKPVIDPIDGIIKFGDVVDLMLLGPRSDVGINTTIVDQLQILRNCERRTASI